MLQAPLEQFEILQLIQINLFSLDFSITNFLLINLLALLSFISFIYFNGVQKKALLSENICKKLLFFLVQILDKKLLNLFLK